MAQIKGHRVGNSKNPPISSLLNPRLFHSLLSIQLTLTKETETPILKQIIIIIIKILIIVFFLFLIFKKGLFPPYFYVSKVVPVAMLFSRAVVGHGGHSHLGLVYG